MATQVSDQRIVTVEVSQAELSTLLVDRAKQAGYIDFDPTRINVQEVDPAAGSFHIIFEKVTP